MKLYNSVSCGFLSLLAAVSAATSVSAQLTYGRGSQANDGLLGNPTQRSLNQVTSVSELRDVQPDAWAYEALKSLVERYGCIIGYPDRTFRGDRALSRYEFAAGLNACMNVMERLIQENVAVLREDIDKLKRLMQEFESELASLGARVDNLESRTAYLEDHQFSTTTKLEGEVVMAVTGIASGTKNEGTEDIPRSTNLGHRTRLQLLTSFTGEDFLYTRLATGTIPDYSDIAGSFQPIFSAAQPDDSDLAVEVLNYVFPVDQEGNLYVWVEAAGGAFDDFTPTLSIMDGDGASGAISAFGTRNPIYYLGEGTGLALEGNWGNLSASLGYLASDAGSPESGNGLFNGAYGAIAQLGYDFSERFEVAFTYATGYNTLDSGVGSTRSNFQFFTEDTFGDAVDTSHNAYALTFSWRIWDYFTLGGWGGFTNARTLTSVESENFTLERGNLDIWNWAVTLGFPDVWQEGNLAGIIIGMQPWVSSSSITFPDDVRTIDGDSSLHLETFFQWAITDNIQVTPGIVIIPNNNYDDRNDTTIMGVVRSTFMF